jgi:hypothetical protein
MLQSYVRYAFLSYELVIALLKMANKRQNM